MLNATSSLHTFSSHHLEQVARELLEAKCNVDHQNNEGWTALMYAAQNGHEEVRAVVVCEVVRRVLRLQYSSIHVLSSHHLEQVARELLKAGAAVDNQTPKQVTALIMACDNAHEECAILLLQAGSRSADLADAWGDAPRSLAEKNGLQNALALM